MNYQEIVVVIVGVALIVTFGAMLYIDLKYDKPEKTTAHK
mgnify:CR=1 FL=1